MHRGGGMGKGSRGGSGSQSEYRRDRDYGPRPGYGRESENRYPDHGAGGSGYDHGGKLEQGSHNDRGGNATRRGVEEHSQNAAGRNNGAGQNGQIDWQKSQSQNGLSGEMLPQDLIASLEKKIASAHTDMSQALQDITGKENQKFDLIFGILIELQRRQAQLEESVRQLSSQLPVPVGMGPPQQQGQSQPMQGQPQIVNGQQQPSPQNQFGGGNQMNSQMGNQSGSQGQTGQMFMANQMNMGQQYGNMVAADGSQAFFTNMPANVVLVASPTGMQQMPQGMQQMQPMSYAMPQMMSGPMQPQMAMQFVSQDQSGGNMQWAFGDESKQASGTSLQAIPNGADASQAKQEPNEQASTDGPAPEEQHPSPDASKAPPADGKKAELRIEEE